MSHKYNRQFIYYVYGCINNVAMERILNHKNKPAPDRNNFTKIVRAMHCSC